MRLSTFPQISRHLGRTRARRGFTLIELMVVVVIIGLLAAIAVPGIARRIDSDRVRSQAEVVANIYRSARLRAMGRGAAVLVRFDDGQLDVREGVWGAGAWNAGCNNLPAPSCIDVATRWDSTSQLNQLVQSLDTSAGGDYTVTARDAVPSTITQLDVCFTPQGQSYLRRGITGAFPVMVEVPDITIQQASGGLARHIAILPNGTTRVYVP